LQGIDDDKSKTIHVMLITWKNKCITKTSIFFWG